MLFCVITTTWICCVIMTTCFFASSQERLKNCVSVGVQMKPFGKKFQQTVQEISTQTGEQGKPWNFATCVTTYLQEKWPRGFSGLKSEPDRVLEARETYRTAAELDELKVHIHTYSHDHGQSVWRSFFKGSNGSENSESLEEVPQN